MKFYLGTHMTEWSRQVAIPWFLSANRLRVRPVRGKVAGSWALDSGGFTELSRHGRWTVSAEQYAGEVRAWSAVMGAPDWIAPQDWMCEPAIRAATGLSVREHQERTIASVVELRALLPGVNVIPVVQGWHWHEYVQHVAMYRDAGIELRMTPVVGVGTVCRRQSTTEGIAILRTMAGMGLRVHGFGVKSEGLQAAGNILASADSMAWSYGGRRRADRTCGKRSCANCLHRALEWRAKILAAPVAAPSPQLPLWGAA